MIAPNTVVEARSTDSDHFDLSTSGSELATTGNVDMFGPGTFYVHNKEEAAPLP